MKALLAHPGVYASFQGAIGAGNFRRTLAREYLQASQGDRILDIGCGTGDILQHLPGVDYHGFDLSADYIRRASSKYGASGRFVCGDVNTAVIEPASFDKVIAIGILHHLNDDEAVGLFRLAHTALNSGGRLLTVDGCYVDDQSRAARYLISKDRGEYMRGLEDYRKLASRIFTDVRTVVRHDLLRIPYTHLVMTLGKTS